MYGNTFLITVVAGVIAGMTSPRLLAANDATVGEPNGVLTLRDASALALARNPQLGIYPYDLRAADALILQAGLRPNPELSVEIEDVGGRGERRGFNAAQTTVGISQPIELGGKRTQRTRVASLDKDLVQWDYKAARLDVMRQVTEAFATVLAAQERLALAERLLELSRQAQTAVAQRVKAGKDSPVDELRADVAFSESRIERGNAQKALVAARHVLAASWGSRAPAFEKVQGDFYKTSEPLPLAQMMAATANNPDLARWQTEEDRRRAALQLEKARAVPDIAVGGGVRRYEQTDDGAFVLGLTVPLPLFNRNQGGILAATAELGKARRQYEAAQVRVSAVLSEAVSTLAAAYDQVTILHNDVLPKAQRAFEAARQGYQQGKFDYLHLLDTQRTLFQTQAQYVNSTEAYHKAQAEVERLTGRPPDTESSDGRPSNPIQQPSAQVK
jgi:cobalt-zinc-cadmium efflux system outer membrane protein